MPADGFRYELVRGELMVKGGVVSEGGGACAYWEQ